MPSAAGSGSRRGGGGGGGGSSGSWTARPPGHVRTASGSGRLLGGMASLGGGSAGTGAGGHGASGSVASGAQLPGAGSGSASAGGSAAAAAAAASGGANVAGVGVAGSSANVGGGGQSSGLARLLGGATSTSNDMLRSMASLRGISDAIDVLRELVPFPGDESDDAQRRRAPVDREHGLGATSLTMMGPTSGAASGALLMPQQQNAGMGRARRGHARHGSYTEGMSRRMGADGGMGQLHVPLSGASGPHHMRNPSAGNDMAVSASNSGAGSGSGTGAANSGYNGAPGHSRRPSGTTASSLGAGIVGALDRATGGGFSGLSSVASSATGLPLPAVFSDEGHSDSDSIDRYSMGNLGSPGASSDVTGDEGSSVNGDFGDDGYYDGVMHGDEATLGNVDEMDEMAPEPAPPRVEFHVFTRWLEKNFPFFALLMLVFVHNHKTGIFLNAWLWAVLMHVNQAVKKQATLRERRSILRLLLVCIILLSHLTFVYFVFRADLLYMSLVFFPPEPRVDVWKALFTVVVNDVAARYITMIIKCILIALIGARTQQRRTRQYYSLVEYVSQFYRVLLPIPVWYQFFVDEQFGQVVSSLVTGLYLAFKLSTVVERTSQLWAAWRAVVRHDFQYGKYATKEEAAEHGNTCPICQEEMKDPIVLSCGHLFCEDCVAEWFERERTCPLCRATVQSAGAGLWRDAGTSCVLQLF